MIGLGLTGDSGLVINGDLGLGITNGEVGEVIPGDFGEVGTPPDLGLDPKRDFALGTGLAGLALDFGEALPLDDPKRDFALGIESSGLELVLDDITALDLTLVLFNGEYGELKPLTFALMVADCRVIGDDADE